MHSRRVEVQLDNKNILDQCVVAVVAGDSRQQVRIINYILESGQRHQDRDDGGGR